MATPAWTATTTFTSGQVVSAANGNAYWRDNLDHLVKPVGAQAAATATQSIANTTWTDLTFDTENWDTDSIHSTVSNTARLTVPTGMTGLYEVHAYVEFAASSGGNNRRLGFLVNGAGSQLGGISTSPQTVSFTVRLSASYFISLTAGDYVTAQVYQDSTGALNVSADRLFTMRKVSN